MLSSLDWLSTVYLERQEWDKLLEMSREASLLAKEQYLKSEQGKSRNAFFGYYTRSATNVGQSYKALGQWRELAAFLE